MNSIVLVHGGESLKLLTDYTNGQFTTSKRGRTPQLLQPC